VTTDGPVIHRMTIPVADEQIVSMYPGGEILSVAPTRDSRSAVVDLWFTTYPNGIEGHRTVRMAGTGHPRPHGRFIGTVITPAGYVWHVFEGEPIFTSPVPKSNHQKGSPE
jgi:hypothetical protein